MFWWQKALYDTCSLITLDKLLLEGSALEKYFPRSILALEVSFSLDFMAQETITRIKRKITLQPPLPLAVYENILASANLSKALADVDKLVYATAVHHRLSVVTGDRPLARALLKKVYE